MHPHTDTGRHAGELLRPAAPGAIQVFDLTKSAGSFETCAEGFPTGIRSFGIWSFLTPKENDLIVIQRKTNKACYLITSVDHDSTFTGSDSNKFWRGVMTDVIEHRLMTADMANALRAAGLA